MSESEVITLKKGEQLFTKEIIDDLRFKVHALKYINPALLGKLIRLSITAMRLNKEDRFNHQFIFTGGREEVELLAKLELGYYKKSFMISLTVYQVLHAVALDENMIGNPQMV